MKKSRLKFIIDKHKHIHTHENWQSLEICTHALNADIQIYKKISPKMRKINEMKREMVQTLTKNLHRYFYDFEENKKEITTFTSTNIEIHTKTCRRTKVYSRTHTHTPLFTYTHLWNTATKNGIQKRSLSLVYIHRETLHTHTHLNTHTRTHIHLTRRWNSDCE